MKKTYFYRDKPLFGMSFGSNDLRVMQLKVQKSGVEVQAFGACEINPTSLKDGVIVNNQVVSDAVKEMFKNDIVGKISTRRVVFSIPAARTFSRAIKLPILSEKELADAVLLEAEQYIPLPVEDLYIDYTQINKTDKEIELFAVAAPKNIIDSYVALAQSLDLEVVAIETTIDSEARLFSFSQHEDTPAVLLDFGNTSVDITIFDHNVLATGTVSGGGANFTEHIAKFMGVSNQEADNIKGTYGLSFSAKQGEITEALDPLLEQFFKEVQRMIRYYEERYPQRPKINQIVIMGSGANVPGLSEHMTNSLRLPVRSIQPWQTIKFGDLAKPAEKDSLGFTAAAGAALLKPKELFL